MSKPMTMVIEVEEIAFGKVFRTLDAMPGVISIHLKGSGPKAPKPAAVSVSATVKSMILGALSEKPHDIDALKDIVAKGGKSATSVPDAINKLKNDKKIASVVGQKGVYRITAAGRNEDK